MRIQRNKNLTYWFITAQSLLVELLFLSKRGNFMKLSNYTIPELNRFRELCNFTDDELEYFNLRSKDKSNVAISISMCVSEPKVSKLARNVKDKIRRIEQME